MGIFDFGKKDKDNKNQSGLVQPPISGGNSQQTQNDNQGNNLQSQSNANTQYSSNSNNLTQSQNYSNQQNLNTNINQENFADPTPLNDDFSQIPQPVLNQNVQNVANQQDDFDPLKWQQELEMQKNSQTSNVEPNPMVSQGPAYSESQTFDAQSENLGQQESTNVNPNFLNENSTNSDTVNQYQNAQVTTNIPQEQQLQSTDQAKEAQAQVNEFSNASLENQVGGQSGEFSQSNLNSDVNNFNPSPIQNEYQSKDETQQNTNLEVNANNSQNNTEQSVDTQMDMQKSNLNTKLFDDNPADDIQIEKDAASDNSSELNIDSNMDQKLEANKNNQNLDNQNTQDQNADKDKEANAETINTDLAGQSKNANNSSDKINRYDKKWYKKTETNSSYEEKDFNTSKIKVLTKPGVVGFNQSNVVDENFLKELVNFYVTNPGRVLFDVNTGKNVSIVNRVANKNVKSTVVVFSPFESMQNDQTLKVSPGDNVTFFYYSNLFEKMIFFIKECRYFIFFDDSHHSTFNFLANLLEFISLYGATSKPVYLFGNSWNTKVTELIRSLNLSEDIKKYLYFINSFDDLKKGLIDYESKMSTNIIPKVFDKRVYGDERDYIIF